MTTEMIENHSEFPCCANSWINLFQFDLDKPWNYPQYCDEKCTSAPFWKSRGKCPCHFPTFRRPCFFSHSIKLFGLLLSAVTVTLHYLPRCLRSTVTSGKTPIAASWCEPLKNWLPCHCYAIRANSGTFFYQVSQPASASKWVGMSEPYAAHHDMIPEQWSWLLCSVSVIPENKLALQELTQLISEFNCSLQAF